MNSKNILNNKTFKFAILLLILLACFFLGKLFNFDVDSFRDYFLQFPVVISSIIFIILYVVLTFFILFGPKDILRITGAVIFGAYTSTIIIWIAETINAFVLFNLSRKLGKDFVEQKFRIRSKDLEESRRESGFIETIILRINPLISFRIMDLGAGLSRIKITTYMLAVVIVSPIRVFWLQYILADVGMNLFKDPKSMMEYFESNQTALFYSAVYFLVVGILSIALVVFKSLRKKRLKKGDINAEPV